MKKYDTYKDSGVKWIGQVPGHWNELRAKNMFVRMARPVREQDEIITCFRDGQVTLRKNRRTEGFTESFKEIGYQGVRKGDLVIHQMDAFAGSVGVSDSDGKGTPVYMCLQPKGAYMNEYYAYVVREMARTGYIKSLYRGIRERSTDFRYETFARQFLPVPPLAEQQAIVDFLKVKTDKIDQYVAQRERERELLDSLKQAEIAKAVTQGLNPDVPMKDSGIPWIGMIPEHWEVRRLKTISKAWSKGNGITKEEVFEDGDTPCVRYGEIYSRYNGVFYNCISRTKKERLSNVRYFGHGDILFAGTGELVDEIGKSIVYMGQEQCLAGGDIIILKHNQNPVFLNYALNSCYAQFQKSCGKAKLKVVHISASEISNIVIAFPPLAEQQAIAKFIESRLQKIDSYIADLQREIDYLKEFKQRLISDAVTGQIKVTD